MSIDEPKIWVIDLKSLRVVSEIALSDKGHQMVQRPRGWRGVGDVEDFRPRTIS